jgi:hypothetical protein
MPERRVTSNHKDVGFPNGLQLAELPQRFIEWQIQSRRDLFAKLLGRTPVSFLASHLPVLATLTPGGEINLANKGVGLVPKEEYLKDYVKLLTHALDQTHGHPWEETLVVRVQTASELLQHPEHIDPYRLGSLEIFEGQTYQNIQKNSKVSLLFTGSSPEYLSFQLDGVAQIVAAEHSVYEFLRLSRLLFEYERFHIAQPAYPWAYQFWVSSVREKTPRRRAG